MSSFVKSVILYCTYFMNIGITNSQWVQSSIPLPRASDCMAPVSSDGSIFLIGNYQSTGCTNQLVEFVIANAQTDPFIDYGCSSATATPESTYGEGDFYTQVAHLLYFIDPYSSSKPDGKTLSIFNTMTKTFTTSWVNIPVPVDYKGCLTSNLHYLYVVGGYDEGETERTDSIYTLNTVQVLNTNTMTWLDNVPSMNVKRNRPSCIVDPFTSKLYAIGGNYGRTGNFSSYHDTIEKISTADILQESWEIITDTLTNPAILIRSVIHQQMIYMIGGKYYNGNNNVALNTVHILDPLTDAISLSPERLPYYISCGAVIIADDVLYVFGGRSLGTVSTKWMKYELATASPTSDPIPSPTDLPTLTPTNIPTTSPTKNPTKSHTQITSVPTSSPTNVPTSTPTRIPSISSSDKPTSVPSPKTTSPPTKHPSLSPTSEPSDIPTEIPSKSSLAAVDTTHVHFIWHAEKEVIDTSIIITLLVVGIIVLFISIIAGVAIRHRRGNNVALCAMCIRAGCKQRKEAMPQVNKVRSLSEALEREKALSDIMNDGDEEVHISDLLAQPDDDMQNKAQLEEIGSESVERGLSERDKEHKAMIKIWLEDIVGLAQYYPLFVENGFESMKFVRAITEISELKELGIESTADQKCIMHQIELLKQRAEAGDDDEISLQRTGEANVEIIEAVTVEGGCHTVINAKAILLGSGKLTKDQPEKLNESPTRKGFEKEIHASEKKINDSLCNELNGNRTVEGIVEEQVVDINESPPIQTVFKEEDAQSKETQNITGRTDDGFDDV